MSKTFNRLALMTMLASSLAMSVTVVDARPGGGKSFGSRGSQTNAAPPSTSTAPRAAQPIQRTVTPAAPAAAAAPAAGAAAGAAGAAAAAAARPSMARNLMMGVGAGLLGAGLFGLLSGSGFFSGLASLAGMLGFLLQIALIGGVIFLVMRMLRSRREAAVATPVSGAPERVARDVHSPMQRQMMGGMMGGAATPAQPVVQPLTLAGEDFGAFEKLLGDVQTAYGAEDIPALRALLTPEMASYFEGDLSDNEAKGVINKVANVKLLQGDLSEAWREASGEYATVAMRYAISDALVDRKTGRTIEGDLAAIGEVTEIWTFMREAGADTAGWKLSAIQQVG
jgi:predicted lipid-binding transport protein (Tim44 family)